MSKLTKAQAAALSAITQAQAENGGEPVDGCQGKKYLGKLPHPNTLDSLVKVGALIEHKPEGAYSYSLYTVA